MIRHAQATRATIDLELRDGRLDLSVVDDGSGFDVRKTMEPAVLGKAVGLMGLQERVEMLGGEFGIDSQPGRGTTVRVRLPV